MMKSRHSIYLFLALSISLAAVSCIDEVFVNDGYGSIGNTIRFNVTSGFGGTDSVTRSGDSCGNDSYDLDPLMLSEGSDTLYLHRDVVSESDRATGRELEAVTRGVPVNTVEDFISVNGVSGFSVMATFTDDGSEYFKFSKAVPCTSDEYADVWHVIDPKRYWPDVRELRFDAFAPASAQDLLKDLNFGGAVTFDYTVPTFTESDGTRRDAEHQPDVMLATTVCTHNTDPDAHTDLATLNFRHALSAIKFAVRDVTDGEIVDISIKGVAGSGSCTFNPYPQEDEKVFEWDNLGDTVHYKQRFNYKTYEPELTDVEDLKNLEETVINDAMPEKTFMLIPQIIPDDAELQLTFQTVTGEVKTLKGKLKTNDVPFWEPGKEYIYTISTTSESWIYVFEVTGSMQDEPLPTDERPEKCEFRDNPDSVVINATVIKGSYYHVKSYRYRTYNDKIKQPVAWTAETTEGTNTVPSKFAEYEDRIPTVLTPHEWFPKKVFDEDGKSFGDVGSVEPVKYDLEFKYQYVATDWDWDWWMRAHDERNSGDKEFTVLYKDEEITVKPIDLSIANSESELRNTANCYVVNSGGWYRFPLYYGNSIKEGKKNEEAYVYNKGEHSEFGYSSLVNFVDYQGRPIKDLPNTPEIRGAVSAALVWSDAYNIIDYVELDKSATPNEVIFHVANEDLQQSNSVIAIRDASGTIMWSWHIWVTEYWVNDATLALNKEDVVACEAWAENEDENATAVVNGFSVAPRNLGWCDAKNVQYLKRTGKMTFKQEKSGKTDKLDVKQRGKWIEYWIGNNTYYQWGRKDPMVGFLNADSQVKYNFGPMEYECIHSYGKEIYESIQNPNQLFGLTSILDWNNASTHNDWLPVGKDYYNLWNNYSRTGNYITSYYEPQFDNNEQLVVTTQTPVQEKDFAYSAVKTVYDPSPAGYVVPPVGFFSLFTKGRAYVDYSNAGDSDGSSHDNATSLNNFNGVAEWKKYYRIQDNPIKKDGVLVPGYDTGYRDRNFYDFKASSKRNGTGDEILLTGTGHRWYRPSTPWGLGGNFNPQYVYLWSNSCSFYRGDRSAFSLAIGQQKNADAGATTGDIFIITSHFQGRKNMARPVRCVKEYEQPQPVQSNQLTVASKFKDKAK